MKKKLFVILLSLVMVVTMMPLSVFADTANASDNAVTTEEVNVDATAEEANSDVIEEETATEEVDSSTDYLSFTAVDADMTLSMVSSSEAPDVTYEYSSDKSSWTDFIPGTTTINIAKDKTIYFRAKEDGQDFPGNKDASLRFAMKGEGKINAGGNIMSLVSKDCSETEMQDYGFWRLFQGCMCLVMPPKLPATTLAPYCYNQMFYNCINLAKAPVLPAMKMAEYCYEYMFSNCSSLAETPLLPATKLATNCYSAMFNKCKNLTKVSSLPATELAEGCYMIMFRYCDSLTKAPKLPAMKLELDCYFGMFGSCSSLEVAPKLPALEMKMQCYCNMFSDCINLKETPKLPATKLAEGCYENMFRRCTNLVKSSRILAESLAPHCFADMFSECSNLNIVNVEFKEWFVDSEGIPATAGWLSSVPAKGTFYCPKELDTSVRDESHVPDGWTISEPVPPKPPVIPTMKSLKAKAVDSKTCELNWDKLTQFNIVEYEVYRGTSPTGKWPKIGETSDNSYTDSTVTSGTKYYYMIRPVVTVDGEDYYGSYSNKDYGYPRINALTGFRVWASDYETANISWNKCLDKDAEFWIYRGTKPTGDWGNVYAKVTKNEATSWSETLTPGSKFYYMVREAVKGNDGKYYFGPYTKVDYAYPRLTAPSNFSAWASDKTTCKCSWTKLPGDGIQYLVYRGNAPTGNWGPAIGSTTDGSYTDKGRSTGHKYYYMVRAKVTVNGKTYFGPYTKVDYGYPR